MYPRLHGAHGLQGSLKQRKGCSHRSICAHVGDIHVRYGPKPATLFGDLFQQRHQNLAWLLVWERHHVIFDGSAGNVHIPEFTGLDGGVIPFDPHSTGF